MLPSSFARLNKPHASLFFKIEPTLHLLNIHIADGSTIHGNSIGSISTSNLSVPWVFQVPDLSYNLFYVGQLAKLGFGLFFTTLDVLRRIDEQGKRWTYVFSGQPSSLIYCSCVCYYCCSFFYTFSHTLVF